jgi:GntR family transcriptional regulator, transcriptional repressor for pyruvate dehydrogenase complex
MALMHEVQAHPFQVVRNTSLSAQISQQLLEAILSGHYEAGEQIPAERDLAVMFSTSRVAVREAL